MTTPTSSQRPPYVVALAVSVVIFAIYLVTLAPTTAFWDTSEYIAAAKVLGIPHPPGNPLFVILAHTFGLLPLAGSYAVRINLFAAGTSAAAAGLWFLITERWLRGVVGHRWPRYAAAFAGVLVGATSWSVWNQSTVNEKVYTVSLLSIALAMWFAVRWGDEAPGPRRDRWLVLVAYILALTSTNHLMGVLVAPAIVVYVLATDWRVVTRLRVIGAVAGAALVGISLNYVWLPLRAAQYPPINEGEPVGFFSQALSDVLHRVQYGKPPLTERMATFQAQLANFWQYFSWQFAHDWGAIAPIAAGVFAALGLFGLWALWKSDRRAGAAGLALLGTLSVGLVFYMNFKYGYSMYPGEQLPREVRERDYFFIGSFAVFGSFIALGLGAIAQWVVNRMGARGTAQLRWATAGAVFLVCLLPVLGNRVTASRAHETFALASAHDTLESVEPYGILVTIGDNDTFPLWYAQEVEGIRKDVTVANLSLMGTQWHLRQLRRRETPAFDPKRSIALWREHPAPVPPTDPIFPQTIAQLDSLPNTLPAPAGVAFGGLRMTFGDRVLQRQDLATVLLIQANLGARPIYFGMSTYPYPDVTLGLRPYLVSQGLVRKLMPAPVVPSDSIVMTELGYADVRRTKTLLRDVYDWQSAARHRPYGWPDPPSSFMFDIYRIVYDNAARMSAAAGDTTFANEAYAIARSIERETDGPAGRRRS